MNGSEEFEEFLTELTDASQRSYEEAQERYGRHSRNIRERLRLVKARTLYTAYAYVASEYERIKAKNTYEKLDSNGHAE